MWSPRYKEPRQMQLKCNKDNVVQYPSVIGPVYLSPSSSFAPMLLLDRLPFSSNISSSFAKGIYVWWLLCMESSILGFGQRWLHRVVCNLDMSLLNNLPNEVFPSPQSSLSYNLPYFLILNVQCGKMHVM